MSTDNSIPTCDKCGLTMIWISAKDENYDGNPKWLGYWTCPDGHLVVPSCSICGAIIHGTRCPNEWCNSNNLPENNWAKVLIPDDELSMIRYCPVCGKELTEKPIEDDGGWCTCPIHGRVHVEYYKPKYIPLR